MPPPTTSPQAVSSGVFFLGGQAGKSMALYFLLATLNKTGQKMLLHNSDQMIDAIRDCHCQGTQILSQYAVLGKYDYVIMAEADDNEAVAGLALEIGVKAGLNTETLPAMAIGVLIENRPDDDKLEAEFADRSTPPTEEWRLADNRP